MLTRRRFCGLAAAAAAGAALGPAAWPRAARAAADPGLQARPLREGAWALTGGGGNSLLLRTAAGIVLVDAKVIGVAAALRGLADATAGAPGTIVNTHHHGDHVGGNGHLRLDGGVTRVIAHANAQPRTAAYLAGQGAAWLDGLAAEPEGAAEAARLRAGLRAEHYQATETFTDRLAVDLGDVTLELSHHGPGHTDNDAVVFIPELNLVHMGDLVFHRLHGFVDMDGGCDPLNWPRVLRSLADIGDEDTILVPGHGEVADRTAIPMMAGYFERLREVVEKALDEGMTRERILELKPAAFAGLGFEQALPRALGGMVDALTRKSH